MSQPDREFFQHALADSNDDSARTAIQAVLDRYALYGIHINPEMRVKVEPGPAKPELVEAGWTQDDFRRAYDHAEETYTRLIEEMPP